MTSQIKDNVFSSWEYVLLIIVIPMVQILEFFLVSGGTITGSVLGAQSVVPYVYFFVFLFIVRRTKYDRAQLGLLIYLVLYTTLFSAFSMANNASYLIPFILTCSLLLIQKDKEIFLNRLQNNIIIGCHLLVIVVYFAFSEERFFEDRFYLVGFIIPHMFSYYCAIFTFYLITQNKVLFALIVTLIGAYVGARSGMIASLVCYLYYLAKVDNRQRFKIALGGIVLVVLSTIYINVSEDFFGKITSLVDQTFESSANRRTSSNDTRTTLWANMLAKVDRDGLGVENFLGRGPRSSYAFNDATLGLNLWMHNDVFEIFFTLGAFGLVVYLYSFYRFFKNYKNAFFIVFLFVLMVTNGFFTYIPMTIVLFFRLMGASYKEPMES